MLATLVFKLLYDLELLRVFSLQLTFIPEIKKIILEVYRL